MYDPIKAGCQCAECPLRGKVAVPPEGSPDADIVIVGESPGQHELKQKRQFVGPAGVMLNKILEKVGRNRDNVFLTTTILCRPETPDAEGRDRFDFKLFLAWIRKENSRRTKAEKTDPQLKELRRLLLGAVDVDVRAGLEEQIANARRKYIHIKSPIDCCAPRLRSELEYFENRAQQLNRPNGAVVIPVGNYAAFATTGKLGIMKIRGSPMPLKDVVIPKEEK